MAVAYVPIAIGDTERALSSRHPASIETSRPRADYHKHLYMRQRIILAYPATGKGGRVDDGSASY